MERYCDCVHLWRNHLQRKFPETDLGHGEVKMKKLTSRGVTRRIMKVLILISGAAMRDDLI